MAYGIIHDLAVGSHPGGADAWAYRRLLAPGIQRRRAAGRLQPARARTGHSRRGTRAPWPRPATGRWPSCSARRCGTAGGLRVDHVMGLMRLWWVPLGQPPDRGAYVSYDHRKSVGALVAAAARAGAVAIGEDLGTVDPWIRDYLAEQGILGTMMLWFAHRATARRCGRGSGAAAAWRRSARTTCRRSSAS